VQLIYWAATYRDFLPGQAFALKIEPARVAVGDVAHALVIARGSEALERLSLRMLRGGETVATVPLSVVPETRSWEAYLSPDEPGTYTVELVTGTPGQSVAPRAALEVAAPASENDNLSADPAFLEQLAAVSGGAVFTGDDIEKAFAMVLPASKPVAEEGQAVWRPAWDRWWLLLLAIAAWGAEWVLRRRSGLL
jgi:hypothetical protein